MGAELVGPVTNVTKDDQELLRKSLTGRFPVLETAEGQTVAESLPIARHLAREHPAFYGSSVQQKSEIDQWIDYINSNVIPTSTRVFNYVLNKTPCDQKTYSIALNEFKQTLSVFEAHFKLRNFLVGHSLTLADAFLVSTLAHAFEVVVDKKTRDGQLSNLGRYTNLILQFDPFVSVFGHVAFCKDATQPSFADKAPAHKQQQQ